MSAVNDLQRMHGKLDVQIVKDLLSSIPEDWFSLKMVVCHHPLSSDNEPFSVTIFTEAGSAFMTPPIEIYEKIISHFNLFDSFGHPWKQITYTLTYDEVQEDWCYSIDYQYA